MLAVKTSQVLLDSKLADCQTNEAVALYWAEHGFPVFPVILIEDDWKPINGWPEKATIQIDVVKAWWRDWPNARVGLVCGERSGTTVLDVDRKNGKDGVETLQGLGFDPLNMSPVVTRTPSGGLHLFFRFDPRLKNWAGKLGLALDTRNSGGYVLAPGSWKDKARYESIGQPLGSIELPAFPETLIPAPKLEREPVTIVSEVTQEQREWATGHLEKKAGELALSEDGTRNDKLNGAAMWAGGAAAHGFITEDRARDVLEAAWLELGKDAREFRTTFKSGFRGGLKKPIRDFPTSVDDDDFDDLPAAQEFDADLLDLLGHTPPKKVSHLKFLSPAECESSKSRGYLIKGLIAPGDVACIFGAPGAGKSLISPYLGYAVAQGREVFGMRAKVGGVFYIAAEDPHGMRGRVKALKIAHGDAPGFTLVEGISDMLAPGSTDLAALLAEVKAREPALIFIDTLAMAFPGLEENDAKSMGRVVAAARKLAEGGAAVVLIHHDTKAEGSTPRGHSLLNGALDVALHVKRGEGGVIRGVLTKNRNGPCDRDLAFTIATESGGADEDGDTITLPRCEEFKGQLPGNMPRLSGKEAAALRVLQDSLLDPFEEIDSDREWIEIDELREACRGDKRLCESEERNSQNVAFKRAIDGLIRKGFVTDVTDSVTRVRHVGLNKTIGLAA